MVVGIKNSREVLGLSRVFSGLIESFPTLVPFKSSSTKRFLSLSMISHFIVACFGEKGPTEWFTVVKS